MAMTLADANRLSNDLLLAGVFETTVKESPILGRLPFIDVVGTAVSYNREGTMASVLPRAVGDTWTEDNLTLTQVTVALKILGGDADVDNFLKASRADTNDLMAISLEAKVKAFAHRWENDFIYGNATTDPLTFDGLQVLMPAGQRISLGSGSTPAVLSLAKLDQLIDSIPGGPDMLVMSKACRRRISTYMRANSSPVNFEVDTFGHRVMSWDKVPIAVSDFIVDTETIASGVFSAKTGGASTTIFALKFGEGALAGLKVGPLPTVENFDKLETKDASRVRVKGYSALALFSTLAIGCIDGISTGAVTA